MIDSKSMSLKCLTMALSCVSIMSVDKLFDYTHLSYVASPYPQEMYIAGN